MNASFSSLERYESIIKFICKYRGIDEGELYKILKDKECKYLFFLLIKKYDCVEFKKLDEDFSIKSKRSVSYNFKKAEEKFFVNSRFRQKYFEVEGIIENLNKIKK